MADLRLQHDEDMCGAGHPTLDDNMARLFLAGGMRNNDGTNNWTTHVEQAADAEPAAGDLALYAADAGGAPGLYLRRESSGLVFRLA